MGRNGFISMYFQRPFTGSFYFIQFLLKFLKRSNDVLISFRNVALPPICRVMISTTSESGSITSKRTLIPARTFSRIRSRLPVEMESSEDPPIKFPFHMTKQIFKIVSVCQLRSILVNTTNSQTHRIRVNDLLQSLLIFIKSQLTQNNS